MANQDSPNDNPNAASLSQVRRAVGTSSSPTISLTPDEQLAFWTALSVPATLTKRQRELGKIMRSER